MTEKIELTSETASSEDMSMEELLKESSPASHRGSLVTAYVVEEKPEGLLVDVGLKVEGFVPLSEFRSLPKPPVKGDTFPALIKRMDGPEGHPLVSFREARERVHWDKVQKAKDTGAPVDGHIVRQVRGGLVVDVGLEAFMPASQVERRPVRDLTPFIGKTLPVVVLEMDTRKGNVVVSHRQYLDNIAAQKRAETVKTLRPGLSVKGKVTGLTHFGVFVDIGGLEGLIRLSDLSWARVTKPSDVLKMGQEIEVQVLKFDAATQKASLGRKQLLPHPWIGIEERLPAGSLRQGKVSSLTDFGAFVELEPGVEGLIHQSEFSWKERWAKPKDYLKTGQPVEVRVLSVNRADEKISLSFKRAGENPWEEAVKHYPVGCRVKGTVTHLVNFGAFVKLPTEIEGLLHVDDISWTKAVNHPKDHVTVGQELELVVLEVNPKEERVSLGLKQLVRDPYSLYKTGDPVQGKVVRFEGTGARVEIAPEVEATLPLFEIPAEEKAARASELLKEGDLVTASVTKINRKSRSIEISVRRYDRAEERKLLKQYRGTGEGVSLGQMTEWGDQSQDD